MTLGPTARYSHVKCARILQGRDVGAMRDDEETVEFARMTRIDDLRDRISSAAYHPDPHAVAQALIQRLLAGAPAAWTRPLEPRSADVLEAR